jgi:hypothetical protein
MRLAASATLSLSFWPRSWARFDPELFEKFAQVLPDTLTTVTQAEQLKAPGPWDALRMICSKDFRRGLAMLDSFLVSLRRSFLSEKND